MKNEKLKNRSKNNWSKIGDGVPTSKILTPKFKEEKMPQ